MTLFLTLFSDNSIPRTRNPCPLFSEWVDEGTNRRVGMSNRLPPPELERLAIEEARSRQDHASFAPTKTVEQAQKENRQGNSIWVVAQT